MINLNRPVCFGLHINRNWNGLEEGKLARKEKIDKSMWWLLLEDQILHYQVTGIQLFSS